MSNNLFFTVSEHDDGEWTSLFRCTLNDDACMVLLNSVHHKQPVYGEFVDVGRVNEEHGPHHVMFAPYATRPSKDEVTTVLATVSRWARLRQRENAQTGVCTCDACKLRAH